MHTTSRALAALTAAIGLVALAAPPATASTTVRGGGCAPNPRVLKVGSVTYGHATGCISARSTLVSADGYVRLARRPARCEVTLTLYRATHPHLTRIDERRYACPASDNASHRYLLPSRTVATENYLSVITVRVPETFTSLSPPIHVP